MCGCFVEMDFPEYKHWMGELDTHGDVFRQGVAEFVEYARRNKGDMFSCPCTKCRNGRNHKYHDVSLHLLQWGIDQTYTFWCWHGRCIHPFFQCNPLRSHR